MDASGKVFNILFVCGDDAVRAPIAAALMNALSSKGFRAFSAGFRPAAEVPVATFDALRVAGAASDEMRPIGLSEFQLAGIPKMDFVFNLTEPTEGYGDITLPGSPLVLSWPIPRPDLETGSSAERSSSMANTVRMIRRRVDLFAELPAQRLDGLAMRLHAEAVHERAEQA
ncbi:hypothetical protein CU669_15650 [Paramagnetospirillum kuznetsovii]|uniref:Phosphotyrosine protein phosphatase I domain-containing protein n=1 Tax=Paramagnetospirillum kuznetsovii TaxID=2053833 RepID=A0A364NVS5_9PROT|nr:hypothetical protein [Paramagnetospirillum kuznetsovii]RAU21017.1 hypothetical protein CU669_15650 [Paramagnetospirillum kuznetsovii]